MAVCASIGEIFLVAGNPRIIDSLRRALRTCAHRIKIFGDLQQFLDRAPENGPSCMLLDFNLTGLDHTEGQRCLAQRRLTVPFIFLLAAPDTPATVAAMRAGAFSVMA